MAEKSINDWYKDARKILSLSLLLVAFSFTYQYAHAASGIVSATADDPDDGDAVYSVGDTITIVFPAATNATASGSMTEAEISANFTFTNPVGLDLFDGDLTGLWNVASTIVTLTVNSIAGVGTPPVVGTTTVAYNPAGGNLFYFPINGSEFTGTAVTLGGDFGLFVALTHHSGGCRGDCYDSPTLGVDEDDGRRIVTHGFTYNGKPIDVERYFTPYPLITVDVGVKNIAEFKIFDEEGPSDIRHFELAFGLSNGQSISTSKASILWDRTFDGVETVTLVDPDNILDNVNVKTKTGKCNTEPAPECLIVTVEHTFRAPPEFNIVGTNVWDATRNSWQNYFNDGIAVVGESMNPPDEIQVLDRVGYPAIITLVDKTHGIDKDGRQWMLDSGWRVVDTPTRELDPVTMHGIDRTNSMFGIYKKGQELIATDLVKSKYGTDIYQSFEFPHLKSINDPYVSMADDVKLKQKILLEQLRATKKLAQYVSSVEK